MIGEYILKSNGKKSAYEEELNVISKVAENMIIERRKMKNDEEMKNKCIAW